jgi:uncharacterized protein
MMMSLGLFIFTLPTVVYQELAHKRDVRFAFNERVGAADAVQFIGPGIEEIDLSGVTAHGINHPNASFAILNQMMQAGKDQPLVDGLGNVYGNYVIQSIELSKTSFRKFGQAKRTEWELSLRRVDNPGGAIRNILLDKALEALGNPEKMLANKLSIASLTAKLPVPLPGLKF